MAATHAIVWDLDGTLGQFEDLNRSRDEGESAIVYTRPGLSEGLATLSAAGFIHVVLTLATSRYAEIALRGTGLREHFLNIDGRGQRGKGDAAGLAEYLGISEAERPARMLFVGDNPTLDAPRDTRIVFHLEVSALTRSAADLVWLILHLRDLGQGSLRAGFDWLAKDRSAEDISISAAGRVWRCWTPDRGNLLLAVSTDQAPLIAFEENPQPPALAPAHRFEPTIVDRQIDNGQ